MSQERPPLLLDESCLYCFFRPASDSPPWVQAMFPFLLAMIMESIISCSVTWTTKILFFAGCSIVFINQFDYPGHGYRVSYHGRLGHARFNSDRLKISFVCIRLQIVPIYRIGMLGLHANNFWQPVYDSGR